MTAGRSRVAERGATHSKGIKFASTYEYLEIYTRPVIDNSSLNVICQHKIPGYKKPAVTVFGTDAQLQHTRDLEEKARQKAWLLHQELHVRLPPGSEKTFFVVGNQKKQKTEHEPRWDVSQEPDHPSHGEVRDLLVDSGASQHMICEKDLNEYELAKIENLETPLEINTANGTVYAEKRTEIWCHELAMSVTAVILPDTSNVLSLGMLCEDDGFNYHWYHQQIPYLEKDGRRVMLQIESKVPYCMAGAKVVAVPDLPLKEPTGKPGCLKKLPQEPDIQRRATSSKPDNKVTCFKCGELGHDMNSCTNKATDKGKEAYQADQD